jgi:hypothetical protein
MVIAVVVMIKLVITVHGKPNSIPIMLPLNLHDSPTPWILLPSSFPDEEGGVQGNKVICPRSTRRYLREL